MKKTGFVGWRGMVGSVLMERMKAELDFRDVDPVFFTTSQAGKIGPDVGSGAATLEDAFDLDVLFRMDIILTCQGGGYTSKVYPQLRNRGWTGYWIDAASTLRMESNSLIVLDPVNSAVIKRGLANGIKDFTAVTARLV